MTEDDKNPSKTFQTFCCEKCNFTTSRLSQYNAHLNTAKHKRMTNDDNFFPDPSTHECICGKKYIHRQGLYKHRKKCSQLCDGKKCIHCNSTGLEIMPYSECSACDGLGTTFFYEMA